MTLSRCALLPIFWCLRHAIAALLGQNIPHQISVHIREPEIPSLEPKRQPQMVDAQQMQHRGV
jgi:hypothetical protein